MALDVARGMQALEAHEPQILHRDLKPSNVVRRSAPRVGFLLRWMRFTAGGSGAPRSTHSPFGTFKALFSFFCIALRHALA